MELIRSNGYDAAVKVFKRVVEFKGRGAYIDGDPRYHKSKFKNNDQRDQVVLWAEKERRNLVRVSRDGVPVPKPLYQKENVLFLRFLGENGCPSPQLKEIDVKKGSKKWTTFYCQTLVAVRRCVCLLMHPIFTLTQPLTLDALAFALDSTIALD